MIEAINQKNVMQQQALTAQNELQKNTFQAQGDSIKAAGQAKAILACGRRSGREGDKFAAVGLTPVPSKVVKAPRLAESFAHIELKVHAVHPVEGVNLYIGRVVHAEAESDVWQENQLP